MSRVIKKVHTYAGLLTFINLMIYGIAGFSALFLPRPEARTHGAMTVTERRFTVLPDLTDRQVAERICADIGLTLAMPVQKEAIHRDSDGTLLLDFWHINGRHKITVLEGEHKLRIEAYRSRLFDYLDTLHATTAVFRSGDWRMQWWAYYNEFAMWSLCGMIASGVWLWLANRPAHHVAHACLAAGTAAFVLLYVLTR